MSRNATSLNQSLIVTYKSSNLTLAEVGPFLTNLDKCINTYAVALVISRSKYRTFFKEKPSTGFISTKITHLENGSVIVAVALYYTAKYPIAAGALTGLSYFFVKDFGKRVIDKVLNGTPIIGKFSKLGRGVKPVTAPPISGPAAKAFYDAVDKVLAEMGKVDGPCEFTIEDKNSGLSFKGRKGTL
jgi:hypothetical protein